MSHRVTLLAAAFCLSACAAPSEWITDRQRYSLYAEGNEYWVTARYDPFRLGWSSEVVPARGLMGAITLEAATELVERDLGPLVCDGAPMEAEGEAIPFETRGGWLLLARCV